jgi:hypothetical protein
VVHATVNALNSDATMKGAQGLTTTPKSDRRDELGRVVLVHGFVAFFSAHDISVRSVLLFRCFRLPVTGGQQSRRRRPTA